MRGPALVWGNLGRDKPHSWILLRARDGRTLATSDSAGGVLKSAHSFWPGLDASDLRDSGLRIIRDKGGAIVGAVCAAKHQGDGAAELRGLAAPAPTPAKARPMTTEKTTDKTEPKPAKKKPAKPPTTARKAPRAKTSAQPDEKGAPLHVIMPKRLHGEIDHVRENIRHATGILPTTATVVRAALEIGLKNLAERVTR
ncbi:MAG: hypothetical protein RLZZ188_2685 [Verrucomicrobiota bacterium]|jgi:predicted component of type VI protein secretion system